jgi:hypothetical protein
MMRILTLLRSKKPTPDLKKIFVEEESYQDILNSGAVYSNLHGIATYVKASFSNCCVDYQDHSHDVHTLAVEVDGTIVVNFGVMNTTMLTEIDSWSS